MSKTCQKGMGPLPVKGRNGERERGYTSTTLSTDTFAIGAPDCSVQSA